jgi:hypothetical protein
MGVETRQNGPPSSTDEFLNLIADPFQAEVGLLIDPYRYNAGCLILAC